MSGTCLIVAPHHHVDATKGFLVDAGYSKHSEVFFKKGVLVNVVSPAGAWKVFEDGTSYDALFLSAELTVAKSLTTPADCSAQAIAVGCLQNNPEAALFTFGSGRDHFAKQLAERMGDTGSIEIKGINGAYLLAALAHTGVNGDQSKPAEPVSHKAVSEVARLTQN